MEVAHFGLLRALRLSIGQDDLTLGALEVRES